MEKLLETVAVQVPHMVILAIVVICFVKHLGKKDKQTNEAFARRDIAIEEMHRENLTAREQSRVVIEKNTVAATQNTVAMQNMTSVLKDFLKHRRNGNGHSEG